MIESVVVNVLGSNGDHEVLTIFETGEDTGIFLGAIPTADVPPAPVSGDCRVSVKAGDAVTIEHADASLQAVLRTTVNISADPYGLVFDSETGAPVDGASVTLVDAATGAPATVFGADGTTPWPSTVISGRPVTDGNGVVHTVASGEYRFPLTALGSYRIVVTPPAPYTAPSTATMAELSNLRRPDGQGLEILPASFGQNLTLSAPALVRVDIPVDRPGEVVGLTMQSSRQTAVAGDQVIHTIKVTNQDHTRIKRGVVLTIRTAAALRIRPGSIWIDGVQVNNGVSLTSDGLGLTIQLDDIAAGGTRTIVYAVTVRSDAAPGTVTSSAEATDRSGASARANVALKIERDVIAGRMTLIGRGALLIDGDARVRRLIGSVSANWSPGKADGTQQTEVGVFAAIRHNFDRYEAFDLKGTSVVAGLDLRFGLAPKLEFGGQVTVRRGITDGTTSYAIGPQVGITPVDNMLLSIGYNITGFRDRDFTASRSTSRGLFAAVRMKFDARLLGSLTGMR